MEERDSKPSVLTMRGNMKNVMNNWNLGPVRASTDPKANKSFWKNIGVVWSIPTKEARYRNCGNCEYGRICPESLKSMDKYPFSKFDEDGGGRVWCEKFDFVCHNLRVCQSWESHKGDIWDMH